jgi:hypothetical protein
MILFKQVREGFVGELLKATMTFLAEQVDRLPYLVIELHAFSNRPQSPNKGRVWGACLIPVEKSLCSSELRSLATFS